MKPNTNVLKPPDLWIHHEQVELKSIDKNNPDAMQVPEEMKPLNTDYSGMDSNSVMPINWVIDSKCLEIQALTAQVWIVLTQYLNIDCSGTESVRLSMLFDLSKYNLSALHAQLMLTLLASGLQLWIVTHIYFLLRYEIDYLGIDSLKVVPWLLLFYCGE